MSCCPETDFMFPFLVDIYYPIITQGVYNEIKKEWVYDRTVSCYAAPLGGLSGQEEIKVDSEIYLQYDQKLTARTSQDIRISSNSEANATTNILLTNIRNSSGEILFKETAGPRSGRATVYEVGTLEPLIGPFGNIEYYNMLWRRTENQASGE